MNRRKASRERGLGTCASDFIQTTPNCARRARLGVANSIESVAPIERLSKNIVFRQSQLQGRNPYGFITLHYSRGAN